MADADLQLRADLDVSDAQRKFRQLGQTGEQIARDIQHDMTGALRASTAETKKLTTALEETGDRARMSAEQIGSMAVAMGGLALNLGAEIARNQGHDAAADYMSGAGGGALAGATAGMAAGPWGAIIGGAAGGIMGAAGTWYRRDTESAQAAEAATEAQRKAALAEERLAAAAARRAEAARTRTSEERTEPERPAIETDSLTRLGVSLTGGALASNAMLDIAHRQLDELVKLNNKDIGGASTWQ